ncbi:MAG: uridine diphosphate-N-acetylglucosamine-binding protein YvcK [Chloroflexi bacterium]|nr:uridine diphosphate-N-acetylglucosamine-binding protein YvcK [Chloroflexota bacterium]
MHPHESGLREQHGGRAPPLRNPRPGDIRSALASLSDPQPAAAPLRDLLEHRFGGPAGSDLDGMAFGNLLLAALTTKTGDFVEAIEAVGRMLQVRGRVLPVTTTSTDLCAELADGSLVEGEAEVRAPGKPAIRRVFVKNPHASVLPQARTALEEADVVLLGPGCLYTSVLACGVVPGVAEAIRSTRGITVLVANMTTTPGQTDGMRLADHVEAAVACMGGDALDYVLVNNSRPSPAMLHAYEALNVRWVEATDADLARIERLGTKPLIRNLLETGWREVRQLHKLDTIRHDGKKILEVLGPLTRTPY